MEKKLWKIEKLADRTMELSLHMAGEAYSSGHMGKGFAVIAEETRHAAKRLLDLVARARFDGDENALDNEEMKDVLRELHLLGLNAAIETERLHVPMHFGAEPEGSRFIVFAEEVRMIAAEVYEAAFGTPAQNLPVPEITDSITTCADLPMFAQFTIGGHRFAENIHFLQEILHYPDADTANGTLRLRNMDCPVIDCAKLLRLTPIENPCYWLIVRPSWGGDKAVYAVPIDDMECADMLFASRIGRSIPCDAPLFKDWARDAWNTAEGGQLMFLDWLKLAVK